MYIRRSDERGAVNLGWLDSRHTFSFGSYYDPDHMGLSVLRVINDDIVQPGGGFGTHGHSDMEIISYVVEGALEHQDSTGNRYVIPAGDVQRMSAGSGITHSEMNASNADPVNFLQIWIQPAVRGIEPEYEQTTVQQNGKLTPMVTPDGRDGSLRINQDACLYRIKLEAGESLELATEARAGYLHVVRGRVNANELELGQGDGVGLAPERTLALATEIGLEAIWFDLPAIGNLPA